MSFLKISNVFLLKWLSSLDKMILFLLITWIILGVIFNSNSTLGFVSLKLYNDPKFLVNKFYLFVFLGSLVIFFSSLFNENFYKQFGKFFFFLFFFFFFNIFFPFMSDINNRSRSKGFKKIVKFYFFKSSTSRAFKAIFNNLFIKYIF